jgi:hypothetical protein
MNFTVRDFASAALSNWADALSAILWYLADFSRSKETPPIEYELWASIPLVSRKFSGPGTDKS